MENHDTTKQPKGLWFIAISFALFSFGLGVLITLLVLYLTEVLKFPTAQAYTLFATFFSFLYILPVYSGRLSDWFGYKRSYVYGIIFAVIGLFLLSIPNRTMLYFSLSLFICGASLELPAFLVLLGKMYEKNDVRRESGFTWFYLIMNVSYLIASIAGGYIEKLVSFHVAFLVSAIVSVTSLLAFYIGHNTIIPHPTRDLTARLKWSQLNMTLALIVTALIPLPIGYYLLKIAAISNELILAFGAVIIIGIFVFALYQKTRAARYKLFAFILLSILSIGFWSLYTLEPSLITIFIKNNVNRAIFDTIIPPSVFYGFNPLFIIVVGVIFSYLWVYLRRRNKDLELPTKFTLSIFIMGIGFLLLALTTAAEGMHGKINMGWPILGYLFFATAELLISPIGLAMVGRLCPEGTEGFLMGVWQVFIGLSAAISSYFAKMAVVPKHGTAIATNPIYSHAFVKIGLIGIALAIISLILIPFIKKAIAMR
ncbi:peptide MFS transporter [Candidiatus Paracoxiella cheracis]|uniref:peptide MFS transporter n=1 Tax=Candidiatus Paracoxiella cheracis TaxID=3405120 RepID=UPI003BF4E755